MQHQPGILQKNISLSALTPSVQKARKRCCGGNPALAPAIVKTLVMASFPISLGLQHKMIDQQNTLFFFTKLTNLSPERLKGGDFVDYREFSQSILLFLF